VPTLAGRKPSKEQFALGITGVATLGAVAFLPQQFWPKCPVYAVTGIYCPGCGGLRATWDILHGNLAGALSQNALIFAMPALVLLGFWAQHTKSRRLRITIIALVAAATVVFTLARNLPGSWLAPDPLV